jgi:antitoxin MazE
MKLRVEYAHCHGRTPEGLDDETALDRPRWRANYLSVDPDGRDTSPKVHAAEFPGDMGAAARWGKAQTTILTVSQPAATGRLPPVDMLISCDYNVIPMAATSKTRLVRIGNSQGIRIPRVIVEQTGLQGELELEVRDRQLVVRPTSRPRAGWDDRFREMAQPRDDRPLWPEAALTSFDEKEWDW